MEKKTSRIQEVNSNIPQIFQNVSCLMLHFDGKFHEIPYIHFPAMLQTDTYLLQNIKKNPAMCMSYQQ